MKAVLRVPLLVLAGLLLVLLLARLLLEPVGLWLLNRQLSDMGAFRGQARSLEAALVKGEVAVGDLRIDSRLEHVEVPIFAVREMKLRFDWSSLAARTPPLARLTLREPVFNYLADVDLAPPPEVSPQTPERPEWHKRLGRLGPIRIDRLRILDGELSWRLYDTAPPVHLYARGVDGFIRNLSHRPGNEGRFADFRLQGTMMKQGRASASGSLDPEKDFDFDLHLRVLGMELTSLNPMMEAFADFDFRGGTGDLVVDFEITDGRMDGFIKPLLHDADIFSFTQDVTEDDKTLMRGMREGLIGLVSELTENQEKNQFASEVHLSGNIFEGADQRPGQALMAILQNGFVQAFTPTFRKEADTE